MNDFFPGARIARSLGFVLNGGYAFVFVHMCNGFYFR